MEVETTLTREENNETESIVKFEEDIVSTENTIATLQEDNPFMIDIANKMAIVYNVLKACIEEKNENVYYYMDFIVNRLAYLTKLPEEILSVITSKTREHHTLQESLLETPDKDIAIRRILVNCYVTKNIIPKTEHLADIVDGHCYNYHLDQQLKRSGYVWRRLPNTKRAIIVEHPKRIIERQRYLHNIIRYRNENRHILYIETKVISKADAEIFHFEKVLPEGINFVVVLIAVANNNRGFINGNIFFSTSIFTCQKLIENYIVKNVVPKLTEPSIIILEDKPYYKKSFPVPTIESEKSKMIKWLESNEIPHEKTFHRCELFELIQKCKTKRDLHKFDAILYSHGHEVLRRPTKTDYLNYYRPLWDNLPLTEEITIAICRKSLAFWENLEVTIIQHEKTALHRDTQLEHVTDQILTMANNTDVTNFAYLECDEHADSLAQEEYLIEIKDSFSSKDLQALEQQYLSEINKFDRFRTKQKGTTVRRNPQMVIN